MGPRDLADMDELLEDLSLILTQANAHSDILKFEDPKTKEFRERLAELGKLSGEMQNTFPRDTFLLVARALKPLSNSVNLLVADFPGSIHDHNQAIEALKTIWFLKVKPEIYRVELALAETGGVILPEDPTLFRGKDRYIREIVFEINRSFRTGAYNGCSVLMRRLVETLIIQVHEKKGTAPAAQNTAGHYYKLEKLIDDIILRNPFVLSRNALDALPKLKRIGDWGHTTETFSSANLISKTSKRMRDYALRSF